MKKILLLLTIVLASICDADACTSMIVSARASASGRPLLWKHRDTGADNNFLQRVQPTEGCYGYVGLFNAGDSLLREAWMGMNDVGFAIMNTASYNLAPDTTDYVDREAFVMTEALRHCASVDQFEALLAQLPKPLGVQANFGVIDAYGGAAYFETTDHSWTRFDANDDPSGVLIRTNYSFSGQEGQGHGYIRYQTARRLSFDAVNSGQVTPMLLTETLSRSFYHSLLGQDFLNSGVQYVVNADFIPRPISTASIVVEGVNNPDDASKIVMWAALGYPPCAPVYHVTLTSIPSELLPFGPQWRSIACDQANQLRQSTIPIIGNNSVEYIDLEKLRPIVEQMHQRSMIVYNKYFR